MSDNFVQNATMRSFGMLAWRAWARAQFWRSGPRIFVNSIPKAGTHLLTSELSRIDGLFNSRLHLLNTEIVRDPRDGSEEPELDLHRIERKIASVRQGQFFSAHLPWTPGIEDLLEEKNVASVFVLRDPRDVLVSRYHYTVGLRRHRLHGFLADAGLSEFERYRLMVEGHEADPYIKPMKDILRQFAGWHESRRSMTVRFEDLIGARGGGSDERKSETFLALARHCSIPEERLPADLAAAPAKTATLRKGKAGTWREELPDNVQQMVEEQCGEELRRLGYD